MDNELSVLLEKARNANLSKEQLEEQRVNIAAANGRLTDGRITVDSMKATKTIMQSAVAGSSEKQAH